MATKQRLTREESQAQTRERLLDAARRAFARWGYGGASVDTIAAEAGYSKGAFYSNFATKETIFLELLARHMAREAAELQRLVDPAGSSEQILSRLNSWLDQLNADVDWALLAMELQLHARRAPAFAAEFDALHAQHREALGGLIARLFALSGKAPPLPPSELAAALMALTHGLVLQGPRQAETPDPAGRLIKTMLRSMIDAAPSL